MSNKALCVLGGPEIDIGGVEMQEKTSLVPWIRIREFPVVIGSPNGRYVVSMLRTVSINCHCTQGGMLMRLANRG